MGLYERLRGEDVEPTTEGPIDRIDTTADVCQYLGIDAAVGSQAYWETIAAAGFSAACDRFEATYDGADHEDEAIAYLEDLAVPALRQRFDAAETGRPAVVPWIRQIHDRFGDGFEPDPAFHYDIDTPRIDAVYDHVRAEYEADAFDQIVGVYSSGLPFMYAASTYLDGDEVVLRYSSYTRDDEEVMITPTMADRQDLTGQDVLIVDDITHSGETLETVGSYVLDHDPAHVEALIGEDQTEYRFEQDDDGSVTVEQIETEDGWRSFFDILS